MGVYGNPEFVASGNGNIVNDASIAESEWFRFRPRVILRGIRNATNLERTEMRLSNVPVLLSALSIACFALVLGTPSPLQAQTDNGENDVLAELDAYLRSHPSLEAGILEAEFAQKPLDLETANRARTALIDHHRRWVKEQRTDEMEAGEIQIDDHRLPFWLKVYGEAPEGGRSLFISMHGGGGAPKRVNDRQWENQKRLYQPAEGVYVAPRAPVDAWNMWHVAQVDALFQRLIENMIVFHNVNPDRVYLMGYSAGGDGVYQIAPRWADHLAAAAMMAGHPNETTPDGLRNLPFCLQMGGKDAAYDRNKIAGQWEEKLAELRKQDPDGYPHLVKIYPDYGHWMNREDAMAVEWMAKFDRNRYPNRIVWKQDDVTHPRFYWLTNADPQPRSRVVVERSGQEIRVVESQDIQQIGFLLDDRMEGLDLAQPIVLKSGDEEKTVTASRTIATLAGTLWERGDPAMMMSAKIDWDLPRPNADAPTPDAATADSKANEDGN